MFVFLRFAREKLENCNKFFHCRFAYVVVRTTGSNTIPSSTSPTRTDPVSHIPTITSSNKLIKSKQSKDEGLKRASVRRTTLGRSKLSRSPVKPLVCTVSSITATNPTVTTTIASSQNSPVHERVEDMLGPVTRSRMCRFCTTTSEDNGSELNYKRGKRSLSNSRFYDKKNKLSRKTQVLATPSITGRKLRKEASLDSALADVAATQEAQDNSSLSEKEIAKTRVKKPTVRSTSQKVLSSNWSKSLESAP